VWSHCMFCHDPLGRNEVVEPFPVGRRLAFDAHRGRLWVVCRRCERWNLTPMEERWEAIEACEELFRATRLRTSTENIGMARLREGLELVRIGAPQRPEFAAWRYGDQFGRRRKRAILVGSGAVAVVGTVAVAGMVSGVISGVVLGQFGNFYNVYQQNRTVARLRTPGGELLKVKGAQLERARFHPRGEGGGDGWDLSVVHTGGETRFTGEEATRMAGRLMARVNRSGGRKATIDDAVRRIEEARHPDAYLARVLEQHTAGARYPQLGITGKPPKKLPAKEIPGAVARLDTPTRLAVEMAIHEEQERRALEGELFLLEQAWKEAEEVAAIADNLLLPEGTEDRLAELKARESAF
jgi:hypothetical protein